MNEKIYILTIYMIRWENKKKKKKKSKKERVTEVPLLLAIWIKFDRTLIDHHPSRIQKQTKETLET